MDKIKIIAEFDGWVANGYNPVFCKKEDVIEYVDYNKPLSYNWRPLPYDKDWNLLMGVVGKIEKTGGENGWYGFQINMYSAIITKPRSTEVLISCGSESSKIKAVFNAVYEFIIWYNQQPK